MTRYYEDFIEYSERVVEVAYRRGSLEVNMASSRVYGVRVFSNGVWSIVSTQDEKEVNIKELKERALKNVKRMLAFKTEGEELIEVDQFTGNVTVGEESSIDDLEDLVLKIVNMIGDAEVVVTMSSRSRIIHGDWGKASDKIVTYELYVYPIISYGKLMVTAGVSSAFSGRLKDLTYKHVSSIVDEARERVNAKVQAKKLSPLSRGRTVVVLDSEVTGGLFHEVSHLLEGDSASGLSRGMRLSTLRLDIYDDPLFLWSPAYRVFDDEAVRCRRKALVEDGEVHERLHTRLSASKSAEETPGNARGLFHKPKAMHSTLVIHPGDWRFKEIIEETKRGFLIKGLVKAELQNGVVIIVPEATWSIEKGEVKEPIKIRNVIIPLFTGLTRISAMGRSLKLRHSYEKGHLVAEVAPEIRTEAYVE